MISGFSLKEYFKELKTDFSYSRMNSFNDCKFKYYLLYVIGMPPPVIDGRQVFNPYMMKGSLMHSFLEENIINILNDPSRENSSS